MTTATAQQVTHDNALVPPEKRVEIGKCNMRINLAKTQKEPTYQVVLDALALTTCYLAFLITVDVPKIYMHQFWFTINKHDSSYRFKIGKKRFTLNVEVFKEILQIRPKLPNQEFDALPLDEEIVSFIKELGLKEDIISITEVTYLAYAIGAATLKKSRKFKKPASPFRKRTLITLAGIVLRGAPVVYTPMKKTTARVEKNKGIDLLFDVVSLEAAQMKKVMKRSKLEKNIHQAVGSGDDEDVQNSNDDLQQDDDEQTNFENQMINDEDEESKDAFIHTLEDYVPTDNETNDETNDVDEKEYERINKEMYSDVNISLIGVEHNNEEKGDIDMTDVAHVQNATTEVPPFSSSHSVSSTYTNAFLNLENFHSTKLEAVSMLDVNVQHKVSRTSPLLTIHVSGILKHTVFNPSETVITAPATTISSLLSSLFLTFNNQHQSQHQITTEATISPLVVPESETLTTIYQRIIGLEKDVEELKNVNNITIVISTIKAEVPNVMKEYIGASLDDVLYKAKFINKGVFVNDPYERMPSNRNREYSQLGKGQSHMGVLGRGCSTVLVG
nr:hypothetical protein [Tanacetum cinerariifolium]